MKCSFGISYFLEEISSLSYLLFSSIFLHWSLRKALLSLLPIFWNSAFKCVYLSFSSLPFAFLLFSANCKASSDNHFAILHFFFLGMVLIIRWPKHRSLSFSISPSNEYSGLISFRMDCFDLLAVQGTLRIFSSIVVQKHQFFSTHISLWSNSHIHTWLLEKPQLWLDGPLSVK